MAASGGSTELRIVINADGSAAIRDIRRVADETRRTSSELSSVEKAAKSASAGLGLVERSAQGASNGLSHVERAAMGSVTAVRSMSSAMQSMENTVRATIGGLGGMERAALESVAAVRSMSAAMRAMETASRTALGGLSSAADAAARNIQRLGQGSRTASADITAVERSAYGASTAMQDLANAAKAFMGFQAIASAAKELFNVAARIEDLNAQYKAMTGSAGAAAAEMGYIREAANRLSMNLDGARDSYGKLLVMVDAGLLNMNQAKQMFEGLSAYARVAGSSSAQVGIAMYGLSQALGQGRVQMTELLQITEPLPGALNRIATAAHMTTGELRAMVMDQSGPGVSSAQLRDWIIAAFGDAVATAEGMSENLSATLTRTGNVWREFLESIAGSSGFNDAVRETLGSITDLLSRMNSDSMGAFARNSAALLVGTFREIVGTIRIVIDNLEVLATVYLGSKLLQAVSIARAAMAAYAVTTVQVQAAMLAMTGTIETTRAAMIAFSTAARVAMTAFWPLLIIAAGAYILLADNTDHAAEASKSYNTVLEQTGGTVESLTEKYRQMSDAQKAATQVSTANELRKQQQALEAQAEAMRNTLLDIRSVISGQFGYNTPKALLDAGLNDAIAGNPDAIARVLRTITELSKVHSEYNTVVNDGATGQKNLLLVLAEQLRDWLKTQEGIRVTQRLLDAMNGTLPDTAEGFNAAAKAAVSAGADFEKAMSKARTTVASFGMDARQLAAFEARAMGANATQERMAEALGAVNQELKTYEDALKSGDQAAASRAEANARHWAEEAARTEAALAARKEYDRLVKEGSVSAVEATRIANSLYDQTYQKAVSAIAIEDTLKRVRDASAKSQAEAAQKSVEASNRSRDASLRETQALNGQSEAEAKLIELQSKAAEEALKIAPEGSDAYKAVYQAKLDELRTEYALSEEKKKNNQLQQEQLQLSKKQAEASDDLAKKADTQRIVQQKINEALVLRGQMLDAIKSTGTVEIALSEMDYTYFQGVLTSEADARAAIARYIQIAQEAHAEYRRLADQGISYTAEQWKTFIDGLNSAEDQKVLEGIEKKTDALREQGTELENSIGLTLANADAYSEEAIQQQLATMATESWTVAQQAAAKERLAAYEQQLRYNTALGALKSVIDQGKTALDNMRSPTERLTDALKAADAAEAALADPQVQAALKKQGVTLEQARKYIVAYREDAKTTASVAADAFKSAADSTYSAWTTMFEELFSGSADAFTNFVDTLKNIFIKALAQMAAAALAQPIIVPVIQAMGIAMGVPGSQQSAILNGIIPGAGSATGGGLFGGFLGSAVGGAIGGLGSLLGSTGMMAGGAMMGNLGLIGGITQSITGGVGMLMSGAVTTGLGMLAAAAIPIIGAITAVAALMGDFGPTPHPSSLAVAGGYNDPKWGPGYMGKGGGGTFSDSGMEYGFSYGHTDPKDAQALRDGLIDIDNALTELVPGVDLAGKSLGAFGQTAEGFIAGTHGLVANQEEMTAWFVKDWVNAANEVGAVSDIVNTAIQGISGSAEDLSAIFAVLMEMDTQGLLNQTVVDIGLAVKGGSEKIKEAMTGLFTLADYRSKDIEQAVGDALFEATATSMEKAARLASDYNEKLANMDWTDASDITELAGLVQQRYDLEIARILEIQGYINNLTSSIDGSLETFETTGMTAQQEYDYWKGKAEQARTDAMNATDPTTAAELFGKSAEYSMNAWGTLTDEQKTQMKGGFSEFFTGLKTDATEKLGGMQQDIVDEHKDTAAELDKVLTAAGETAAAAIVEAGNAIKDAGEAVATGLSSIRQILVSEGYIAPLPGYASGGIVGGAWNGKSGRAGDTVITALTPGEVVIPRAQAQQHMSLLSAIAANDVQYAASGSLPSYNGSGQRVNKYGQVVEVPVVPDGDGAFGDPYVYTPGQGMTGDYWTEQLKSGNVPGIAGGTDPQGWNGLTEEQFAYYQENYARQANFPPSSGDEGGSSSATDTADQLADFMKGISRSLRDMDLSDYQRQFQAVADTLADNIEQATSLGASEEQLNQIRELGRRQAEALAQAERDKVRSFLSELGMDASLSPAERMAEAQRQYDEAFAAARDGLTGADEVTAAARKLLDESMGYYGSGSNYQAILDAIRAGMGNLSFTPAPAPAADAAPVDGPQTVSELKALVRVQSEGNQALLAKLTAVEARLAGIESAARLEAAA